MTLLAHRVMNVKLEMERRRAYALEHCIQKIEQATTINPFAGRVICGCCGKIYGRKVWNSTNERLSRIIWRCNGKYPAKGEKGCDSRHIDDGALYRAFINVFNVIVENKDYFLEKCRERLESDNLLQKYKAKQFIGIISRAEQTTEFDMDLYFAIVEKITVHDGGRLIVSLLDSTDIECLIE